MRTFKGLFIHCHSCFFHEWKIFQQLEWMKEQFRTFLGYAAVRNFPCFDVTEQRTVTVWLINFYVRLLLVRCSLAILFVKLPVYVGHCAGRTIYLHSEFWSPYSSVFIANDIVASWADRGLHS